MYHEVILESQPLPEGYDSYSLLLIPDLEWFTDQQEGAAFKLFRRFHEFGSILGPRHLAAWFYSAFVGSFYSHTDLQVLVPITRPVSSKSVLRSELRKKGSYASESVASGLGSYDKTRARHICALYGLSFNQGPYIAYYDKLPMVPLGRNFPMMKESKRVTPPLFVLRFGGLPLSSVLSLLNDLEFRLLRDPSRVGGMSLQQWRLRLNQVLRSSMSTLGDSVKIIKAVKDAIV